MRAGCKDNRGAAPGSSNIPYVTILMDVDEASAFWMPPNMAPDCSYVCQRRFLQLSARWLRVGPRIALAPDHSDGEIGL